MIEELVPPPATTAHAFTDHEAAVTALYPQEAAAVAQAVPKRRREYATVRMCARRALNGLGVPPAPLVAGRRGAPRWPTGVVGSMTHCPGYRAAVVGRSGDFLGLGADAEPNEPLPDDLLDFVSLPGERARLRELAAAAPEVCWDRLLFSAKEAVFKTWYPLAERELDFSEAELDFDPEAGTFSARLLVPGVSAGGLRIEGFSGRWLCRDGLVVTAIAVERPAGR
ncbi:4'-phosphopantetheinyl transferase superfamily protein [Streptomyces sp. CB01881]|uniref:4'-phosphopantetheinyl transferase family protein n=1 Tax=Streptomyces sp. CB01881 TaxID=2078691 RepID=UPI000CDC5160|nr:4'-phosphopantetheinyl transferase superfamily protein [Streptomyces sp. CB01881]AUY48407.1 4'-phosphopantetheinyl transferase [Streptomyces sp. CB01881]TYC76897.1 4'-phosphopantetheinyl transferase superfamily protein [Streptomyces sp. CB01881]